MKSNLGIILITAIVTQIVVSWIFYSRNHKYRHYTEQMCIKYRANNACKVLHHDFKWEDVEKL